MQDERRPVSYSIAELDSLQPGIASKLRSFGIRTTSKLLEAAKDPKGRKSLAERTGLIKALTERVLESALTNAKRGAPAGSMSASRSTFRDAT